MQYWSTRQNRALDNCIYDNDWSSDSEQGHTEAQAKAMLNPRNDALTLLNSAIQADTVMNLPLVERIVDREKTACIMLCYGRDLYV